MTIAQKIKAGVDLLESFANDYQFDKTDPGYLGFINVGEDLLFHQENKDTWVYIVTNPDVFLPILDRLGLCIEGGTFSFDETVFTKNS